MLCESKKRGGWRGTKGFFSSVSLAVTQCLEGSYSRISTMIYSAYWRLGRRFYGVLFTLELDLSCASERTTSQRLQQAALPNFLIDSPVFCCAVKHLQWYRLSTGYTCLRDSRRTYWRRMQTSSTLDHSLSLNVILRHWGCGEAISSLSAAWFASSAARSSLLTQENMTGASPLGGQH